MSTTLPLAELWHEIREKRYTRLQTTDWTQMPDSPLTAEKRAEWATYRQQLRDITTVIKSHSNYTTEEDTNPRDDCGEWRWPTKPS
tara:strand:- start:61 stop:318 length:258 start_codon:yes stop_codon:yes gene_type:complete